MAATETARPPARFGTHGRGLDRRPHHADVARRGDRRVGLPAVPRRLRPRRVADVEALPAGHRRARARGVLRDRLGPAHRACARRSPAASRSSASRRSPGPGPTRNSGGSVASQLRHAGYDGAASSRGTRERADAARGPRRRGARSSPPASSGARRSRRCSTRCAQRFGGKCEVGVSAIGPAGEQQARIASVMNDRYHAFGRQGFGAIYGSKNLKAIVVAGIGRGADRRPRRASARSARRSPTSTRATSAWLMRAHGLVHQAEALPRLDVPAVRAARASRSRRRSRRCASCGASAARPARSRSAIENGDAPIKNWKGVGSRDFPLATQGLKLDGAAGRQVHHQEALVRRLPDAVQGHRRGQVPRALRRAPARLRDDRRLRRQPPERRPRAGHRVPRRLQPLRHRRGELERDARLGLRGGRGGHPHRRGPRRHRHALGQRRGRARAHHQDGHRRGLRRVAAPRRRARRRSTSARAASASPSTSTARSPRTTTRASPR